MTASTLGVSVDLPDGRTVSAGHLEAQFGSGGRVLIGTRFEYVGSYLSDHASYALCPELPLGRGPIISSGARPVAGAFMDAGPDWWGRNLLFSTERRDARLQGRAMEVLTDLDFIARVHDETRQGALRFTIGADPTFQAPGRGGVPTLVDLPELVAAARRHGEHQETDSDLDLLTRAGTSMGGARPKTGVRTADGRLALAKLPSEDDRWNVLAWEATALELARLAGIEVPDGEVHALSPDAAVLVVTRFDRNPDGSRIGYLSAHSLIEKTLNSATSYVEIAEQLGDFSANPDEDGTELFRRVVLSLLIGNVDDHAKNHGLVRTAAGWRLSPVFDINPFPNVGMVDATPLTPGGDGSHRTVAELVGAAEAFGLDGASATAIVGQVESATSRWEQVAAGFGIEQDEIAFMSRAFESDARLEARAQPVIDTSLAQSRSDAHGWVGPHVRNGKQVRGYQRRPAR